MQMVTWIPVRDFWKKGCPCMWWWSMLKGQEGYGPAHECKRIWDWKKKWQGELEGRCTWMLDGGPTDDSCGWLEWNLGRRWQVTSLRRAWRDLHIRIANYWKEVVGRTAGCWSYVWISWSEVVQFGICGWTDDHGKDCWIENYCLTRSLREEQNAGEREFEVVDRERIQCSQYVWKNYVRTILGSRFFITYADVPVVLLEWKRWTHVTA